MNEDYYSISVTDGKMYLRGGQIYSTVLAVKRFEVAINNDETVDFPEGFRYIGKYSEDADAILGNDYKIAWRDEFNNTSLDNNSWNYIENQMSGVNNKTSVVNSDAVSTTNGNLIIQPSYDENNYYGGEISTRGKMSYRYGYVEARMQIPDINGFLSAFWMRTTNATSSAEKFSFAEVDVFERLNSGNIKSSVLKWNVDKSTGSSVLSGGELNSSQDILYNKNMKTQLDGNWHTVGMEWTNTELKFIVDGEVQFTYKYSRYEELKNILNNNNMYLIFSLYTGKESNIASALDENADWTQSFKIDYVHLYQDASGVLKIG